MVRNTDIGGDGIVVMADSQFNRRFRKLVLILITMSDPPLKVLIVCLGALAISL